MSEKPTQQFSSMKIFMKFFSSCGKHGNNHVEPPQLQNVGKTVFFLGVFLVLFWLFETWGNYKIAHGTWVFLQVPKDSKREIAAKIPIKTVFCYSKCPENLHYIGYCVCLLGENPENPTCPHENHLFACGKVGFSGFLPDKLTK